MSKSPDMTRRDFDTYMDEFFDSDEQIEDYIRQIGDRSLRDFVISLAEKSASADGLDPRENVALQKILAVWSDTRP
jgi:hypothetical protein